MITAKTPRLNLHGEEVAMVNSLVNEFVKDNYLMAKKEIIVIHGKSTNILTKEVHQVLKNNPYVASFHLNNWNLGETIINLK